MRLVICEGPPRRKIVFQLIAKRYEKTSTIQTSNKSLSQWNDVFSDVTIASASWTGFCTLHGDQQSRANFIVKGEGGYEAKQFIANTLFADRS
jgi:hypothetical protein